MKMSGLYATVKMSGLHATVKISGMRLNTQRIISNDLLPLGCRRRRCLLCGRRATCVQVIRAKRLALSVLGGAEVLSGTCPSRARARPTYP